MFSFNFKTMHDEDLLEIWSVLFMPPQWQASPPDIECKNYHIINRHRVTKENIKVHGALLICHSFDFYNLPFFHFYHFVIASLTTCVQQNMRTQLAHIFFALQLLFIQIIKFLSFNACNCWQIYNIYLFMSHCSFKFE